MEHNVWIDNLIIGTGPAGASLACFLASHGMFLACITYSSSWKDCRSEGAHYIKHVWWYNYTSGSYHEYGRLSDQECLRDIGLEEECLRAATKADNMQHTRWCYSMAGEEFGRVYAWGNHPKRKGDYEEASPCRHVDLPQTLLEPILIQYAIRNGFNCRFNTSLVEFSELENGTILSVLEDNVTSVRYKIHSRYLFGCDGARSVVARQLDLPLTEYPGGGLALNILARVDLSKLMANRNGNLHWVFQPDREHPSFDWATVVRMVKPWSEWVFVMFPDRSAEQLHTPSEAECIEQIKKVVGDETLEVTILDISKWRINETYAKQYSKGNVFCLGDAVHRHPPFYGLGSNTCIQDAFNLAWKVAYVEKGKAGPKLMDSYSIERQPVGAAIVSRANEALRNHRPVWRVLGMLEPSAAERKEKFALLKAASKEGSESREELHRALKGNEREFNGLGIEMGQQYKSVAVILDDEESSLPEPEDPILEYPLTTYPGRRLPHAWLNTSIPGNPISTIDLAGRGRVCLFTGAGGDAWKAWSEKVSASEGVDIVCFRIGWRQDYEDVYLKWMELREVTDTGCVLVRPDRFVAWRCRAIEEGSEQKLRTVLRRVLAKEGDGQ